MKSRDIWIHKDEFTDREYDAQCEWEIKPDDDKIGNFVHLKDAATYDKIVNTLMLIATATTRWHPETGHYIDATYREVAQETLENIGELRGTKKDHTQVGPK